MSFNFRIEKSEVIEGVLLIQPDTFQDHRGLIWTSYLENKLLNNLSNTELRFSHDKFSTSNKNVLRGIHFDNKSWKLVSCVYGEVLQVAVDLRPESNTYLMHQKFNLDYNTPNSVLLPPGVGNAFYVKSDVAVYHYKLSYAGEYNDESQQFTVAWDDPALDIKWPARDPLLSYRDASAKYLKQKGHSETKIGKN